MVSLGPELGTETQEGVYVRNTENLVLKLTTDAVEVATGKKPPGLGEIWDELWDGILITTEWEI